MSDLRDAVAQAVEGTPYRVVDTDRGFDLELDVANAQWWDLFGRSGLKRAFRWKVTEGKSSFTITDEDRVITWQGGEPGLGASFSKQKGRIFSFSRTNIWALSAGGRIEPVVNYRFNSREGRDLIRLAAKPLGLKEGMPRAIKATIIVLVVITLLVAALDIWDMRHPSKHDDCVGVDIFSSTNQSFQDQVAKWPRTRGKEYRDWAENLRQKAWLIDDPTLRAKADHVADLAAKYAVLKQEPDVPWARPRRSESEAAARLAEIDQQIKSGVADLQESCQKRSSQAVVNGTS